MRSHLASAVLIGGLVFTAPPLGAQVVERPVAFDSGGRVMTITPPLAARLKLSPPMWPVTGDFEEARLFDRGDGTFVVVVQRTGGVVERYQLASDAREVLRQSITSAMLATGNPSTTERQDVVSEPAKGQFVRDQTLAAAVFYGPALASLTTSGSAAAAMYLASVGATFFTSAQLAKTRSISKAQNHMATTGAWRGGAIASGLLYVAAGDSVSGDVSAAVALGGAIAGTIFGFQAGLPLTDGEAHGSTFGSTFTTLTTAGLIGSFGGLSGDLARGEVAGLIGAAIVGFPLGLRYVRRASYGITPGDITTMSTAALIGVLGAATFIGDSRPSGEVVAATLTAGFVAGTLAGDRIFVRRYDFTQSQGRLMGLGALAGALLGIAAPIAVESNDPRVYFGGASLGAMVGMVLTKGIITPATGVQRGRTGAARASGRELLNQSSTSGSRGPRLQLHLLNAGILFAHPRARASVPLLSLAF
ncbi:MAG: hypothetical protein Q8K82_25715 [Gemmatimonadaceae bacterium]|nr:hypothetical protein [Gemmatimonadaceae bacterium]